MTSSPATGLRALRQTAARFSALQTVLPSPDHPDRAPTLAGVAHLIRDLATATADLSTRTGHRLDADRGEQSATMLTFAVAIHDAASALATASLVIQHMLCLDRLEANPDLPGRSEEIRKVRIAIRNGLCDTHDEIGDVVLGMRLATSKAEAVSQQTAVPPTAQVHAALARSPTPTVAPSHHLGPPEPKAAKQPPSRSHR